MDSRNKRIFLATVKKFGAFAITITISWNASAQFLAGLENVHGLISTMHTSTAGGSLASWADGILGTREAIRVTENPSISMLAHRGHNRATRRDIRVNDQRAANAMRQVGNPAILRTILHDNTMSLRNYTERYLVNRSLAFIWRNNPTSTQFREAVIRMRNLNDQILELKISNSRVVAQAQTIGLELNNSGRLVPRTEGSTTAAANTGQSNTTRRSGNTGSTPTRWQRIRNTFGRLGRWLRRFRRGRGGRLYQPVVVNDNDVSHLQPATVISVYPNPTIDLLNIKLCQEEQDIQVMLYDLQGRMILNQPLTGNQKIHTLQLNHLNLTGSAYILHVTSSGQVLATEKIYIK